MFYWPIHTFNFRFWSCGSRIVECEFPVQTGQDGHCFAIGVRGLLLALAELWPWSGTLLLLLLFRQTRNKLQRNKCCPFFILALLLNFPPKNLILQKAIFGWKFHSKVSITTLACRCCFCSESQGINQNEINLDHFSSVPYFWISR